MEVLLFKEIDHTCRRALSGQPLCLSLSPCQLPTPTLWEIFHKAMSFIAASSKVPEVLQGDISKGPWANSGHSTIVRINDTRKR